MKLAADRGRRVVVGQSRADAKTERNERCKVPVLCRDFSDLFFADERTYDVRICLYGKDVRLNGYGLVDIANGKVGVYASGLGNVDDDSPLHEGVKALCSGLKVVGSDVQSIESEVTAVVADGIGNEARLLLGERNLGSRNSRSVFVKNSSCDG